MIDIVEDACLGLLHEFKVERNNYITELGYQRLIEERDFLTKEERPGNHEDGSMGRQAWVTDQKMLTINMVKRGFEKLIVVSGF